LYFQVFTQVLTCHPYISHSIERTRAHLRSSLSAQRLRGIDVDIIMLDDGSTDASLPLLSSIASNPLYHNYSVISLSPNGGAAAARNAGVSAATGKVIAFAESDDWYLDHHLWSCLSPFIKDPNTAFTKTKIFMSQDIHPHWQTGVEDVSPLNTCARREAFLFAGGFPTTSLFRDDMEDGHLAIIMHSIYRGAKLYTHTSRYRMRDGNQLHQRMPQFTSPPGQAPLIQSDVENTEKRMTAIQVSTVNAKDRQSRACATSPPVFSALISGAAGCLHSHDAFCLVFERHCKALFTRLVQSRYPLQEHGLVLWLRLDPAGLAEALAHLLYSEKRNPFMIWVPIHEIQEREKRQQRVLVNANCSYMSIINSNWATEDRMHPCLTPPAPVQESSFPSLAEVSVTSILSPPPAVSVLLSRGFF
jgi:hypothetical protein